MSSSARYPSGGGLELDTTPSEKYPSPKYPYNNAPQVVQPEKYYVGMTNYVQESAFQEAKAVEDKRICGLRRRNFWIVLGSFGVALLVAFIAVIAVLSQKVSQNKRYISE